jgi:hypothetical protein
MRRRRPRFGRYPAHPALRITLASQQTRPRRSTTTPGTSAAAAQERPDNPRRKESTKWIRNI